MKTKTTVKAGMAGDAGYGIGGYIGPGTSPIWYENFGDGLVLA
jgi:hypothetical protein